MADETTTNGEQDVVTPTAEQLEAMRDFRSAGWDGPVGEQRRKREAQFDERVAKLQALLDLAVEEIDTAEGKTIAVAFIRRVRTLRQEGEPYSGMSVNQLDAAKITRW